MQRTEGFHRTSEVKVFIEKHVYSVLLEKKKVVTLLSQQYVPFIPKDKSLQCLID